ncbi:MAG: hypothetical protein K9M49_05055 [Candidatus Marinimicrobia bacterium]|nr:hypothetical protein [Candidatus Neomarinimicrobiota bacterium]MCF7904504.1 hypothetical protein [Candidatus Neomarinimicrobiota bacterium]
MFVTLLLITFFIALACSFIVVRLFQNPIDRILGRIVSTDISGAWNRYISFAIVVVGVSGGVRVWDLEKYITRQSKDLEVIVLNSERWVLEVYRTIIGTLQSTAWLLLVFFIFALIAYVITRGFELRHGSPS